MDISHITFYIKRAPAVGRPFEFVVMLPPLKRIDKMDKWEDEFESMKDFIDCLNKPSNASGSLGRIAAATIQELQKEINELKERTK